MSKRIQFDELGAAVIAPDDLAVLNAELITLRAENEQLKAAAINDSSTIHQLIAECDKLRKALEAATEPPIWLKTSAEDAHVMMLGGEYLVWWQTTRAEALKK